MKTKQTIKLLCFCLLSSAFCLPAFAQGTAFTYQGRLQNNGSPASGTYNLTFTLFNTNTSGAAIAGPVTNNGVVITNGLFTVILDFGSTVWNGATNWLEIGVETNLTLVFTILTPRQQMTPVPYAVFANTANNVNGTISSASLSGTYGNPVTMNNVSNNFGGTFSGNGANLTNVSAVTLSGLTASSFWKTTGNSGISPTNGNFLGSSDNAPLELRVNGQRALRVEPTSDTPNLIGGYVGNYVQPGLPGVTIGGGGTAIANQPNVVTNNGYYATISGGYRNAVGGYGGAILGGSVNVALGDFDTIGGGQFHTTHGAYNTIGGGYTNQTSGNYATVGGGGANMASGLYSSIGGGVGNVASGQSSVVAGGGSVVPFIGALGNYVTGDFTSIGGGIFNIAATNFATVAGGGVNTASGFGATVAGGGGIDSSFNGYPNTASGNWSAIGGGAKNAATNDYATVAGGQGNLAGGAFSITVPNFNFVCVTNTIYFTNYILGKEVVLSFPEFGTCPLLSTNVFPSVGATVGGGLLNTASGYASTVIGGQRNVASGSAATVAGGYGNSAAGAYSFAAGSSAIANNDFSFVWSDLDTGFSSTASHTFNVRASSGIHLDESTSQYFGTKTRQMLNLWGTSYGIGVQGFVTYFRCDGGSPGNNGFAWYQGGVHNDGRFNPGGGVTLMTLNNSSLTVSGTFVSASDRNQKEHFAPVNARDLLDKVAALPLTTWNYKQDTGTRHLGPMAQDFYAAFKVGPDDKHITTIDEGGVALAAIQGLNEKLNEKDAKIVELEKRLERLEQIINSKNGGGQ